METIFLWKSTLDNSLRNAVVETSKRFATSCFAVVLFSSFSLHPPKIRGKRKQTEKEKRAKRRKKQHRKRIACRMGNKRRIRCKTEIEIAFYSTLCCCTICNRIVTSFIGWCRFYLIFFFDMFTDSSFLGPHYLLCVWVCVVFKRVFVSISMRFRALPLSHISLLLLWIVLVYGIKMCASNNNSNIMG